MDKPTHQELDRLIAEAAREGAAETFGVHFADRVVAGVRHRQGLVRGLAPSTAPGVFRRALAGQLSWPTRMRWVQAGVLRPALVLATILFVVASWDWMRPHRIEADSASRETLSFSDGSAVTLGEGSSLTYHRFFLRDERRVELEGEAFFDVATTGQPFVVSTFNTVIQVTGTRFNVRSWAEASRPETVVSLEEGGVRLQSAGSQPVDLIPGQSVRVGEGGTTLEERLTVPDAKLWLTGGLTLVDVPLGDALATLERRFGVRLPIDPSLAGRMTTYVSSDAGRIEDILDAICFALDLRYRPELDGYRIEPNTSR